VSPDRTTAFEAQLAGVAVSHLGEVTDTAELHIASHGRTLIRQDLATLKTAWQAPLDWK
jgi:hypothetical protein